MECSGGVTPNQFRGQRCTPMTYLCLWFSTSGHCCRNSPTEVRNIVYTNATTTASAAGYAKVTHRLDGSKSGTSLDRAHKTQLNSKKQHICRIVFVHLLSGILIKDHQLQFPLLHQRYHLLLLPSRSATAPLSHPQRPSHPIGVEMSATHN
jgi:hypothetical protein